MDDIIAPLVVESDRLQRLFYRACDPGVRHTEAGRIRQRLSLMLRWRRVSEEILPLNLKYERSRWTRYFADTRHLLHKPGCADLTGLTTWITSYSGLPPEEAHLRSGALHSCFGEFEPAVALEPLPRGYSLEPAIPQPADARLRAMGGGLPNVFLAHVSLYETLEFVHQQRGHMQGHPQEQENLVRAAKLAQALGGALNESPTALIRVVKEFAQR